jgi:hypothetical protein
MYNVSIRNKYFELIKLNTFIWLFILFINYIKYIQVNYTENPTEKYSFIYTNITFPWKFKLHI